MATRKRDERAYRPIIYIRGFAATEAEIENAVADPFMGFNLGSTKLRQTADAEVVQFIFESPLVRLTKDHGYRDAYHAGGYPRLEDYAAGKAPRPDNRSLWVFRYYDATSASFGRDRRHSIEFYAHQLRRLILHVRDAVAGDDPAARADFRVYLVAHSMGGLIARCYLQALCRGRLADYEGRGKEAEELAALGELELPAAGGTVESHVDKLFTYGTPHGGIEALGLNVPDLGPLSFTDARTFNHDRMREYLGIAADGPVQGLDGALPPERVFCFVGTNYRDYGAFFGLAKRVTGPRSDGLVMCENAYVEGAAQAYAHRSHSGPYGVVNSEEGYQNLRRFLFGTHRVDIQFDLQQLLLPRAVEELLAARQVEAEQLRGTLQVESAARVRGSQIFLHERRVAQDCAQLRSLAPWMPTGRETRENRLFYLFSGFLDATLRPQKPVAAARGRDLTQWQNSMVFALELGVRLPEITVDRTWFFDEHIEGGDLLREDLVFQVSGFDRGQPEIRYGRLGDPSAEENLTLVPSRPQGEGIVLYVPVGRRLGPTERPRTGAASGMLEIVVRPVALR